MLYYMGDVSLHRGSVWLTGDSPIREQSFNSCWRGVGVLEIFGQRPRKIYNPPLGV